jgi:hypothetical protein
MGSLEIANPEPTTPSFRFTSTKAIDNEVNHSSQQLIAVITSYMCRTHLQLGCSRLDIAILV